MKKVYLDELDEEKLKELESYIIISIFKFADEENFEYEVPGRYDLVSAIREAIRREFHKARRHVIQDDEYWLAKRRRSYE